MNLRLIFTVLILVSVLTMSNLSEKLAFAQEEKEKGGLNVLQQVLDDLLSAFEEFRVFLDTLRIDLNTEVEDRTNADLALQAEIDELRTLLNEAPTTAAVSQFYSNTKTVTTLAGEGSSHIISCEDGDTAISAYLSKLVNESEFLQIFSSFQSDDSTWTFLVVNTDATDSIDFALTITCLRAAV